MPRLVVDPGAVSAGLLAPAAAWLAHAGLIIFPTDTYYGLGADPRSSEAVDAIFTIKGRDSGQAIPIVAESIDAVRNVARGWSPRVDHLARTFWPGPLSIVIPAFPALADGVHGGLGTIAVRVPEHAVARALAHSAGGFVTATSANRSGAPPARAVSELDAIADDPRILVVDGGTTPGGAPSTIVDLRSGTPIAVRQGAVSWDRVMAAWHDSR